MIQCKLGRLVFADLAIFLVAPVQNQSNFLVGDELVVHAEPKGNQARNDLKGELQKVSGDLPDHVLCFGVVSHQIVDAELYEGHQEGDARRQPGLFARRELGRGFGRLGRCRFGLPQRHQQYDVDEGHRSVCFMLCVVFVRKGTKAGTERVRM